MNDRIFPVLVFILAFCVSLYGFVSIPQNLMSGWMQIILAFNLLVAFANILVAYWVWQDADNIDATEDALRKEINRLRGIVDANFKTVNDNFDLVDNRLKKLEQKQSG